MHYISYRWGISSVQGRERASYEGVGSPRETADADLLSLGADPAVLVRDEGGDVHLHGVVGASVGCRPERTVDSSPRSGVYVGRSPVASCLRTASTSVGRLAL